MALDMKKLREKQLETSKAGGNYYKPKAGKNNIRVFKFPHMVTKEDVAMGLFNKDKLGKITEELDRPITLHYGWSAEDKKPVISNGAIMAEYARLKASEEDADQQRAVDIRPSKRYGLNIVDMDAQEAGIKLWAAPKSVYNGILEVLLDTEYGGEQEFVGCKGRDFVVTFNPESDPMNMYRVLPRAESNSEELPSEVAKRVIDLYAPSALALFGKVMSDEVDDDPEQPAAPAPTPNRNKPSLASVEKQNKSWLDAPRGPKKPAFRR